MQESNSVEKYSSQNKRCLRCHKVVYETERVAVSDVKAEP